MTLFFFLLLSNVVSVPAVPRGRSLADGGVPLACLCRWVYCRCVRTELWLWSLLVDVVNGSICAVPTLTKSCLYCVREWNWPWTKFFFFFSFKLHTTVWNSRAWCVTCSTVLYLFSRFILSSSQCVRYCIKLFFRVKGESNELCLFLYCIFCAQESICPYCELL